jgi:hypothetical protein
VLISLRACTNQKSQFTRPQGLCSVALILLCACIGTGNVVINEIHYDPDIKTEAVEFIELHNTAAVDIDLSGWYFSTGISYLFPAGSTLSAGGYIIVAYSPAQIDSKWSDNRSGIPPHWVFGPFQGRLANEGEVIELRNPDGDLVDRVEYRLGFPWPTVGDPVPISQPGSGCSIQLINPSLDNDLAGSWRSAPPTPAAHNESVYHDNTPPLIRQVKHSPKQPKSDEPVIITAKITDSDGIASVILSYQIVEPGHYISIYDSQYYLNWTDVAMNDDGLNGDAVAGDDIYSRQLPGSMQIHRRLIRYRITAEDRARWGLLVPYADDPQPNFAYFVYNGVPAWSGAIRPGVTPVVRYGTDVMRSLPVYHLISKKSDVETCTWLEKYTGSNYKWFGTLVYDGDVYDHIRYRARGGTWRYSMGKNMWKFDFNRGHFFQAKDDYGRKYKTTWDKLNFSACIQQGDYQHRGEQGMFEAVTFKLFNMMGTPASKTNWLQFRIIDERYEDGLLNAAHPSLTSRGTQYDGDFWGLYMTIEQMDGRFLEEHGLPDGNMYKIEGHQGQIANQGLMGVTDGSDLAAFKQGYYSGSDPTEQWWRANVDLDSYFSYRCAVEGAHHGDVGYGKNYYFYFNPETCLCSQLPWDVDLTWANNMYGDGEDPFRKQGGVTQRAALMIEQQNRLREFHDLLYNADQMGQLLDEFASIIDDPAGGPSIVDADRAMWDYHWVMHSNAVSAGYRPSHGSGKAGQGRFYQKAPSKDFPGMVQIMKDYVVSGNRQFDTYYDDALIPRTPVVTATCPSTFPINALTFEAGPFSDPQGHSTFAAMEWRIAEVSPGSQIVSPDEDIVLIPDGADWKYFKGTEEPSPRDHTAWRELGFDDRFWPQGVTPVGWGEPTSFLATTLTGMQYQYTSFYVRKKFTVEDVSRIDTLRLEAVYDDGFNVWINDTLVLQENMPSENIPYDGYASGSHSSEKSWFTFTLPDPTYLAEGENIIAVQVQNMSRTSSSDCFIDVRLTGKLGDPTDVPPNYRVTEGKYEIDAVWESGEITNNNSEIRIPASRVKAGRTYRIRCRMMDHTNRWSHWSMPIQFVTGEPIAAHILNNLRITELMYNPPDSPIGEATDNDEFEFIELKNTGDEPIDLTSLSFIDGIEFDFINSHVPSLEPDDFVLVVGNETAFLSRYGAALSTKIAGEYAGRLSNNSETVSLIDFWNGTIAEFTYNDGRGWPIAADGGGHSLVPWMTALPGEPNGSLNYGGNWRASTYIGGSPGMDNPERADSIILNEIAANTTFTDPQYPQYASNDWIELYNTSADSINLHDWYLSDDVTELKKWAIPAVEIDGFGYFSFDEMTGFHNPIDTGFGLSKAGEQVILSYLSGTSEDRIVDSVSFKAQRENASLGRYPDGGTYWFEMIPSRDLTNENPLLHVVVDEIMYHPALETDDEYIELYNPTASRIFLADAEGSWRLDGAVEYTFGANASIPSGGRLVVVGFDPGMEASRLFAFIAAYNTGPLTAGVDIVGPCLGNLSNAGERIALERPLPPDDPAQQISWGIVEEVIYADVSPWPESADGTGDALQRISSDEYRSGNDPDNWQATTPTPGFYNAEIKVQNAE